MADSGKDVRRLRIPDEIWEAFGDLVGNGGRSAAIRNYIEWQLANPDQPLPGQYRVPFKVRRSTEKD